MPKKKMKKPSAKKAAKKPAKKKPVKKKAAKRPAKKVVKKAAVRKAAPKSKVTAKAPAQPPLMKKPPAPLAAAEQKVGMVVHYYTHLSVAVVKLEQGQLQSMEIEHQKIQRATAGQEFGLKVVDHVREHDEVYKVIG